VYGDDILLSSEILELKTSILKTVMYHLTMEMKMRRRLQCVNRFQHVAKKCGVWNPSASSLADFFMRQIQLPKIFGY
jgi:hypothetical protein